MDKKGGMMKKYMFLLLSIAAAAGALFADFNGGYGGFIASGIYAKNDEMNAKFESRSIEFDKYQFGFGGMGFAVAKGYVVGGFGMGADKSYATEDLRIDYSYGSGSFMFGRMFDARVTKIALLGFLGGGSDVLNLRPSLNDISFDSLVSNPGRVATLSRGGMQVGAGIMLLFPVNEWMCVGVRGNAFYGIGWDWELEDGATVYDTPNDMPLKIDAGISFLFGGGGNG